MRLIGICFAIWTTLTGLAWAQERTMTVTGEGTVSEAADQAVITVGAAHRASSAQMAMAHVNDTVGTMLGTLRKAGIAPEDIQTSGLGLHPVYDHNRKGNDRPLLLGFNATSRLTVKVRDISTVGDVLGALVEAGANDIGGISFGLSDPDQAQNAARQDAVADAQAKASLYAQSASVSLGKVLTIREGGSSMPGPEMMRASMASFDAVPVAAGELSVSARVEMVFELLD